MDAKGKLQSGPPKAIHAKESAAALVLPARLDWPSAILGSRPDGQIALLLGCSSAAVFARGTTHGIPAFGHRKKVLWTKGEDALLGTDTDAVIARKLNRPLSAVTKRRLMLGKWFTSGSKLWTTKEYTLLGTMPDKDFAAKTGRTVAATRAMREKLGRPPKNPIWKPWTEAERELLARLPIREVARLTGHSLKSCRGTRDRLVFAPVK